MGSHFEQANRMSFWIGLENLPNSHCVSSFDWRGDPIVGRRLCKLSEKSALTPGIAHWSLSFRWMATNSRTFLPRSVSTPALFLFHLTRQKQKVEHNVSPLLLMSVKSHVCPKPNTHLFILQRAINLRCRWYFSISHKVGLTWFRMSQKSVLVMVEIAV